MIDITYTMPKRNRTEEEQGEDITVDDAPTSINPYQVLNLEKSASQDDIKKAYRRGALQHHPDKASEEDKAAAHSKFQEIAFAYAILSDERRRRRYDTTGRTEESLDLDDDDFDWADFFRAQFKDVITEEKLTEFESQYKGSEEERRDVLTAYTTYKGNWVKIFGTVMLSDMIDDEARFRAIIDEALMNGKVEAFKKYTEEGETAKTKRREKARKEKERETKEWEEGRKEREAEKEAAAGKHGKKKSRKDDTPGSMGDLAALIQQRQKGRQENFFDNLEAKYAPKGKKGMATKPMDEPPEEAFAANRTRGSSGRKKAK